MYTGCSDSDERTSLALMNDVQVMSEVTDLCHLWCSVRGYYELCRDREYRTVTAVITVRVDAEFISMYLK